MILFFHNRNDKKKKIFLISKITPVKLLNQMKTEERNRYRCVEDDGV